MYDKDKINKMVRAGEILSNILIAVRKKVKIGTRLIDLDRYAEELCRKYEVLPAFKGYEGFPATLCVGVNDVVVHGIPNNYELKDGDIVSIDMGVKYKGVYSDAAFTELVGKVSKDVKEFVETAKNSLYEAVSMATPGNTVGDIGYAMENTVLKKGYSVVYEMVGHGVGYNLHEAPDIPCYGEKGEGEVLYRGQTIAIEAIINMGEPEIVISDKDKWTSHTKDGMLSALFEHTLVVEKKPRILTKW